MTIETDQVVRAIQRTKDRLAEKEHNSKEYVVLYRQGFLEALKWAIESIILETPGSNVDMRKVEEELRCL